LKKVIGARIARQKQDRRLLPVTFVSLTTDHHASLLPRLDFVLTLKTCS
jgi:hypothetical protein